MESSTRQLAAIFSLFAFVLSPLLPIPFPNELARLLHSLWEIARGQWWRSEYDADRALEGRLFSSAITGDESERRQSATTWRP